MRKPDYRGGSIVNLMASIMAARGGQAELPELRALPASALAPARHLALLLIDGLGANWLRRHAPDGLLARHRVAEIDTVFPTTTASAVTSFLTGLEPRQHGVTGWFVYLRELGGVFKILSGQPRAGGLDYRQAGIDVRALLDARPLSARITAPTTVVAPREIARSPFNLAHLGRARLRQFASLKELFVQLGRALLGNGPARYVYAYWPQLDGIGHREGIDSPAAVAHFQAIEQELERCLERLAGSGVCLLVTADHGQIDTNPEDVIDLNAHAELRDCLRLPLCGEPRAAFCYLRPDQQARLRAYCAEAFGDRLRIASSAELLADGWFGEGATHPELIHRIGDLILLGNGRTVVRDRLFTEQPFVQIGVHGGVSEDELRVPLCLFPG